MPKVKLTYKDGKWYRNGVEIKNPRTYTFIDQNGKKVVGLHNWNPTTPYIDKIRNRLASHREEYKRNVARSTPPFPTQDYSGMRVPMVSHVPANMLDTIAINTGRSGTNIEDNLGLAMNRESYWMNNLIHEPEMIYKQSLVPDDYNDYPEQAYLNQLEDRFGYQSGYNYDKVAAEQQAKEDYNSGRFHNFISSQPRYFNDQPNFLVDNYIRWANVPDDYVWSERKPYKDDTEFLYDKQEVRNLGKEFFARPEVQRWWNNEGKKYYNKGLKERFK